MASSIPLIPNRQVLFGVKLRNTVVILYFTLLQLFCGQGGCLDFITYPSEYKYTLELDQSAVEEEEPISIYSVSGRMKLEEGLFPLTLTLALTGAGTAVVEVSEAAQRCSGLNLTEGAALCGRLPTEPRPRSTSGGHQQQQPQP